MSDEKKAYTLEELESMLRGAISIESYEKYGLHSMPDNKIGTVRHDKRIYDLYLGAKGNTYYSVRIATKDRIVSEFESIFGITEKQMRKKYKERK